MYVLVYIYNILYVHPGKLTWNLKIPLCKRRNIYKLPIVGFHVFEVVCLCQSKCVCVRVSQLLLKPILQTCEDVQKVANLAKYMSMQLKLVKKSNVAFQRCLASTDHYGLLTYP